jgi:hypothetical protein
MDEHQNPQDDRNGQGPDDGVPASRPVPPPPPVPPTGPQGWQGAPPAHPSPYGPVVSQSPYGQSPYSQSPYGVNGQPAQQSPYGYAPQPGYATPSRRPGIIPLTPLSLGDLLGGSFAAMRRNAAAVIGTALLVALVDVIVSIVAMNILFDVTDDILASEMSGQDPFAGDPLTNPIFSQLFGSVGLLILGALLASLAGLVANGVLAIVVLRSAAGLKTSLAQAWKLTGRQIWTLVGLGLLYLVAGLVSGLVFLGVLIGLIGASAAGDGGMAGLLGVLLFALFIGLGVIWIWLSIKFLLAPAAAAVELKGPWKALGRSWSLTRRHWWRTFGIVLLVVVIVGIVSSVITTPLSMISGVAAPLAPTESPQEMLDSSRLWANITMVASGLVNALALAYLSCLVALVYVDYRIRHESFDLDLGAAADAAGLGDDERFSTVKDVQAAAGTDALVPGRHTAAGTGQPGPSGY